MRADHLIRVARGGLRSKLLGGMLLAAACLGGQALAEREPRIKWVEISPGYSYCRFDGASGSVISSPIILSKFNLKYFSVHAAVAADFGERTSDAQTLVKTLGGVAGINANFFDPHGAPLGLVVRDEEVRQKIHQGGNVLTGVFYVKKGTPRLVHRSDFAYDKVETAIQAGPRLIENGKALQLNSPNASSRRSGVALTRNQEVLFYVTELRFPGATLTEVQDMLLMPELDAVEALNLDGGGSSQLYLKRPASDGGDLLISGGDRVPVVLVVKKRAKPLP